jgi:hypothetical protein
MKYLVRILILLLLFLTTSSAQIPTLRDLANKADRPRHLRITYYVLFDLAQLIENTDLIVTGTVLGGKPFLAPDEREIKTDYVLQVREVIRRDSKRDRTPVNAGAGIIIRRLGGQLQIDGKPVIFEESRFPQWKKAEEYLLFLSFDEKSRAYEVFAGPQSAFRIIDNRARAVNPTLPMAEYKDIDLDSFTSQIRTLAASLAGK